ncbi:hypothetical protein [Flavobacterium sp.]|uniref:hypothetical protein n=1 Tax=Flavobacterium sp. TaxID=239 RepID=UPI002B4B7219|nr:hypothetical protein [Flavobacterium sp.]HLP64496.1 hypothetical protein [Flavobacterium sp.]
MRLFNYLLVACVLVTFSSCSITEKIIFNEDNSGKFACEIDGSKMMSMMGSAIKAETEKKSKKKKKKNKEGERELADIDSTFTFKELMASKQDSIAKLPLEEQEKFKRMENFSIRMVMNEEKSIFNYTLFTDFKAISDLNDLMSPMESVKSFNGGNKSVGNNGDMMKDNNSSEYSFDGKVFKKKVRKLVADNSDKDAQLSKEEAEYAAGKEESMKLIYDQSDFKVVYQFPRAVKKVSIPNALYSEDRKTVTILFDMKEYMENPESLSFDVELE